MDETHDGPTNVSGAATTQAPQVAPSRPPPARSRVGDTLEWTSADLASSPLDQPDVEADLRQLKITQKRSRDRVMRKPKSNRWEWDRVRVDSSAGVERTSAGTPLTLCEVLAAMVREALEYERGQRIGGIDGTAKDAEGSDSES